MKILFLSTWFPYPPDNGSKLRAYYLAKSLAEHHDVTVIAFRPESSEEWGGNGELAPKQPVIAVPDDPYRYVGIPQWAKYISLSPVAFRCSPAMQEAIAAQASKGAWDVVVAVQMPVAQYALRVPAMSRVIDVDTAMTFQLHDRYQCENRRLARTSHWISWQKARRYETAMLRHFGAITVVWQAEADFLRRMIRTNSPVEVIPNGVDSVYNRFGFGEPHPNTLVYNGSLTYGANYDAMHWFLAEIYPLIKAEQPDVRLAITGSTKGVDLSRLAIDDSVCLTGFVDDVRVPVASSALCVVPIRQGSGTRLKVLEAMALGTPVVSTTKGAEGHEAVDGEHLLLADTPVEFARATLAVLADAELRGRLAANARRLVEERYDWKRIGNRFVTLVEETLAARQKLRTGKQRSA